MFWLQGWRYHRWSAALLMELWKSIMEGHGSSRSHNIWKSERARGLGSQYSIQRISHGTPLSPSMSCLLKFCYLPITLWAGDRAFDTSFGEHRRPKLYLNSSLVSQTLQRLLAQTEYQSYLGIRSLLATNDAEVLSLRCWS